MTLAHTIKQMGLATALASTFATAHADDQRDVRVGTVYSGNLAEQAQFKTTLGIAPQGAYDGAVIAHKGQFMESFRAYDLYNQTQKTHTFLAGFKTPSLQLGTLENKAIIFGAGGDTQGLALETDHTLGNLSAQFNGEHAFRSDKTRVGAGINYQAGKAQIGFSYDLIGSKTDTHQFLINGIVDFTPRSTVGAGLAIQEALCDINRGHENEQILVTPYLDTCLIGSGGL